MNNIPIWIVLGILFLIVIIVLFEAVFYFKKIEKNTTDKMKNKQKKMEYKIKDVQ